MPLSRYLYLNTYALLLIALGLLAAASPFWLLTPFTLIAQLPVAIFLVLCGAVLLSGWSAKKREYAVLMAKNRRVFRPESFQMYMEAPCGRKLTRAVLKDLGKEDEYKNLLVYKPTIKEEVVSVFRKPSARITYFDEKLVNAINARTMFRYALTGYSTTNG